MRPEAERPKSPTRLKAPTALRIEKRMKQAPAAISIILLIFVICGALN
jgi:hypothetical protein